MVSCSLFRVKMRLNDLDFFSGTFDADTQLCCGPVGKKILLKRASVHHRCCGQGQYDPETECCCEVDQALQIRPIGSECCEQLGSGVCKC